MLCLCVSGGVKCRCAKMAENRQDKSVRLQNSAGSRPSSATRDDTMHWFAHLGPHSSGNAEDKEARIKTFKERQNEERQRKLDEMKHQALAAQRFKEQKEQERRQRLDELRIKEDERRQQVEERKKAINDAERDRLESILKRNQEREARIEAKRKTDMKSSMVFAFGSSTPRILGPTENSSSFWGHRRATSTQNVNYSPAAPLTRRQSERELDGGSKKRATSAGGIERSGEAMPQHPAGCISGYVGRRRTDLTPTIPAKETPSTSPRKPFMRSPGRAYSMSRLDQLSKPRKRPTDLPTLAETSNNSSFKPLSHPQQSSVSRSMSHLAFNKLGPIQSQKPLRKADSRSMHQLSTAVTLPSPRTTRATELRQKKVASTNCFSQVEASSRPSSSLSQQSTSSVTSSVIMRSRPSTAPRHPRPASIAVTGITNDLRNGTEFKKPENKPPLPKIKKSSLVKSQEKIGKKKLPASPTEGSKTVLSPTTTTPIGNLIDITPSQGSVDTEKSVNLIIIDENKLVVNGQVDKDAEVADNLQIEQLKQIDQHPPSDAIEDIQLKLENINLLKDEKGDIEKEVVKDNIVKIEDTDKTDTSTVTDVQTDIFENQNNEIDMTTSMNSKPRITTEEEAKAALAERRRIAREEAEKQAELERLRIEEETRLEIERQQREEEQQRQLIELQRAAEEERLKEAIKEAQRREEEEKLRREEELRLKILKEEAELKAREEAERQKAELQERLKNEEKEREARRKRVEAIMLRTRGKNNSNNSSPQTEDKNVENKFDSKVNGSKTDTEENGHKNGRDIETVDNIIPVDTIKNANTVNVTTLSTDDTLNSNDAWQRNSQTDLLM